MTVIAATEHYRGNGKPKTGYSHDVAVEQRDRLNAVRVGRSARWRCYHCSVCGRWHVRQGKAASPWRT